MPHLPQLEAAPASFGLAPSTPSGIPARALQPQQQGPEFPSSPMGGPQLGCGTSRAPWRAVPYTCPSPLPTERVSPPDFIPPLWEPPPTGGASHPASSPPHASHSVQSLCLPRELHICPAHSHRAPLYCSSISRLERHTSLFQDPFRDGPQ